jgi:hypothetical protein
MRERCANFARKKQKSVGETVFTSHRDAHSVPYSLFLEPGGELFALFLQFLRNDAAERIEKLFVLG